MSAFTYAQTFLITAAIKFLETPAGRRNRNHAYGLMGAVALIYFGIAFSTAAFWQRVLRLTAGFRGATTALIHDKALVRQAGYNHMAALTLMSTDVERMKVSMFAVLELYAQITEVAVGIWLLWRQLGVFSIAPIVVVILCTSIQSYYSKFMGGRQAKCVSVSFILTINCANAP